MRAWAFVLLLGACSDSARDDARAPDAEASTPAPRTLTVDVLDGQGQPLKSCTVWWGESDAPRFGSAVSGYDSPVALRDLPRSTITIAALPDGYVVPPHGWPRTVVKPDATRVRLTMDVGATRTLRVLGWDGGFSGDVRFAATQDLEPSHHGIEDDGTIHLEGLRPGMSYNLFVRHRDSHRCALLRGLRSEHPWPEIELGQGYPVTGTIQTPAGCEGGSVAVLVDQCVMIDGSVELNGRFKIPAVPQGTWTVVAYTIHNEKYYAARADVTVRGRGARVALVLEETPTR